MTHQDADGFHIYVFIQYPLAERPPALAKVKPDPDIILDHAIAPRVRE